MVFECEIDHVVCIHTESSYHKLFQSTTINLYLAILSESGYNKKKNYYIFEVKNGKYNISGFKYQR